MTSKMNSQNGNRDFANDCLLPEHKTKHTETLRSKANATIDIEQISFVCSDTEIK